MLRFAPRNRTAISGVESRKCFAFHGTKQSVGAAAAGPVTPRVFDRAYGWKFYPLLVGCSAIWIVAGCASWPHAWGAKPCCITTKPVITRQPVWWHLIDVTVLEPIEQPFHVIRFTRKLLGHPLPALDGRHGEPEDSAFFTNRDPASLSSEAVRWGPTHPEDLGAPPFLITKPKTEGKTPGFFVTDARGVRYLLKLDPAGAPELLSGAEVVTSKLLYVLGYHVPSYEVAMIRPDELQLNPETTLKDSDGHPFRDAQLRVLLAPHLRHGTLRVSATKILDGEILGPARFKWFRRCTAIRALKVAYAWVNNIDAKDHNSLLVWNGKETVGYLIDFGTSLGADAGPGGPKSRCAGWTNLVDVQELSLTMFTLGWHRPTCDPAHDAQDARVGFFTPHVNPDHWKPYVPNWAFEEMTLEDAKWMAKRLGRLTRAQLEAAVSAGQYSDSADASYLVEMLDQRRLTIVQHYADPQLAGGSRR